jgi:hypothetical protein
MGTMVGESAKIVFVSHKRIFIPLFLDDDFGVDDFTDPTHLNLEGAMKFSGKLRGYIEKESVQ